MKNELGLPFNVFNISLRNPLKKHLFSEVVFYLASQHPYKLTDVLLVFMNVLNQISLLYWLSHLIHFRRPHPHLFSSLFIAIIIRNDFCVFSYSTTFIPPYILRSRFRKQYLTSFSYLLIRCSFPLTDKDSSRKFIFTASVPLRFLSVTVQTGSIYIVNSSTITPQT